jgi:hypothetical protein
MKLRAEQDELLQKYVSTFSAFDEMTVDLSPMAAAEQLAIAEEDEYGFRHWKPIKVEAPQSQLDEIYAELPEQFRFPSLFERLLLTYRWAGVDLGTYRLLSNAPGPDLNDFFQQMTSPYLWETLLPANFVPFGKGPDLDYDPVCFDMKSRKQGGDCRIVKIDHEQILCNYRVKVVAELAPSFYQLVLETISRAPERST